MAGRRTPCVMSQALPAPPAMRLRKHLFAIYCAVCVALITAAVFVEVADNRSIAAQFPEATYIGVIFAPCSKDHFYGRRLERIDTEWRYWYDACYDWSSGKWDIKEKARELSEAEYQRRSDSYKRWALSP